MRGENIIVFAKDWGADPTSCNQVMNVLARENRVLWLNSIASRTPNLAQGKDLRKIVNKLAGFFRGAKQVGERMWVYTPIVLPMHGKPWAVQLNRMILRASLGALRRKLGMRDFQLWVWVPTTGPYANHLGAKLVVYYYTDNWTSFSTVDGAQMKRWVEDLAGSCDVLFCTSNTLADDLRPLNPETHVALHGVQWEKFRQALDHALPIPADLADVTTPIIGYFGLVEDWNDLELLLRLAERHPEWTFAFVGKVMVDVSALERLPNVRFLGRKSHDELPAYCKAFSVGLIPHRVNELTWHMNPIKLREYLSAGVPVVSTALPEVRAYADRVCVAETHEEFEAGILRTLAEETPEKRQARSDSMRGETWDAKVTEWSALVLDVHQRKTGAQRPTAVQSDLQL